MPIDIPYICKSLKPVNMPKECLGEIFSPNNRYLKIFFVYLDQPSGAAHLFTGPNRSTMLTNAVISDNFNEIVKKRKMYLLTFDSHSWLMVFRST